MTEIESRVSGDCGLLLAFGLGQRIVPTQTGIPEGPGVNSVRYLGDMPSDRLYVPFYKWGDSPSMLRRGLPG
jgi:hypothetical protein